MSIINVSSQTMTGMRENVWILVSCKQKTKSKKKKENLCWHWQVKRGKEMKTWLFINLPFTSYLSLRQYTLADSDESRIKFTLLVDGNKRFVQSALGRFVCTPTNNSKKIARQCSYQLFSLRTRDWSQLRSPGKQPRQYTDALDVLPIYPQKRGC